MTFLGGQSQGIQDVNSVQGSGTAAAPGAGVSFCGVSPNPPAGIYSLFGFFVITGAIEAAALNVALVLNNATFTTYPTSGGVNAIVTVSVPRWVHNGVVAPFLKAVAAATAATVYSANLIATQLDA